MESWIIGNLHWILTTVLYIGIMIGTLLMLKKQIKEDRIKHTSDLKQYRVDMKEIAEKFNKSTERLSAAISAIEKSMISDQKCDSLRSQCSSMICNKLGDFISLISEDRKFHREDVNRVFDEISKNRKELLDAVKEVRRSQ